MDVHMESIREGGMGSFRRSVSALAGALFTAIVIAGAAPASAAPPFPNATQATALVSGTPLVEARCPSGPTVSGGTSTRGIVSVGTSAGARCSTTAAAADGEYAITGATPPLPNTLRFSADCVTSSETTNGGVDVPANTFVTGVGVVATKTLVQTPNTVVTYPGGPTAILNEIIITGSSVQRNAIRITSGSASGTVVGRVICGTATVYPLAAETASASGPAPALASISTTGGSGSSNTRLLVLAGGAFALLVLAQVTIGRSMWRRRRAVTGE